MTSTTPSPAPSVDVTEAKAKARGMLVWFLSRYGITETTVDEMILAFEATLRHVRGVADELRAGQADLQSRMTSLEAAVALLPPRIPLAPPLPVVKPGALGHGRKNLERTDGTRTD